MPFRPALAELRVARRVSFLHYTAFSAVETTLAPMNSNKALGEIC
jgi:hypothetical protein